MKRRWQVHITGIVQGVGFRPFLFALAEKHGLVGSACNDGHGVALDIEGDEKALKNFLADCRSDAPPLAVVENITCENAGALRGLAAFSIAESLNQEQNKFTLLSPDVAVCDDCLRELSDSHDRRFQYPFINCTNCGPRFTIIEDVPYDRARTTMSAFPMCAACAGEYSDPRNRRFHAQPNACEVCGPRLSQPGDETTVGNEALALTIEWLRQGGIVAIKGIGGYHLACDALNDAAVRKLRERKLREDKPFALMADSLMTIRQFCAVSEIEESLLLSPARPIVLLKKLPTAETTISPAVAPQQKQLGLMLPYAPLHHLLLARCGGLLVMTSGNVSDEPIAYRDEEACTRLGEIADHFLTHDRRIHMRCDDSVACVRRGKPMLLRRARGYVPQPLRLRRSFAAPVLSCGAELKNTFCLTRDHYAFVSHHIGDLENPETLRSFEEGIAHFERLFYLQPEIVAHDLHPEYLSTKYALARGDELPVIGVQHHHAHIISCLADNDALDSDEPVLGVAFDGLGYGTDGKLWGGEFLLSSPSQFERVAHLQYQPLPGGAKAIREPWRMAAVFLQDAYGEDFTVLNLPLVQRHSGSDWRVLRQMISQGLNAPLTSSMGRIFDAVAALLELRDVARYEAQAAIELEMIVDEGDGGDGYDFAIADQIIQPAPLIRAIVDDLLARTAPALIAAKFHGAVARLIRILADQVRSTHQIKRIVLSGGVFQNRVLLERAVSLLEADGFEVLTHSRVPPNDGGISLGQAVIADALIREGKV